MEPATHLAIDRRLVGVPLALGEGWAEVELRTLPEMAADARGLVHGGFVFGLADYAGMLAINHGHVVLGAAELRFLLPVVVGDTLRARARRVDGDEPAETPGKKAKRARVEVEVLRGEAAIWDGRADSGDSGGSAAPIEVVLRGHLTCFVPPNHVLDRPGSPGPKNINRNEHRGPADRAG